MRLVPSCCVIFDFEPLSLSFDFVFNLEIFKSFPCVSLSTLPSCDLVSWYRHAHHLESLITISLDNLCLDNLDIFKEDLENQNQNRYLVTSLIHIESRKSPTAVLFDDDTRKISIVTVNTQEYHSDVLAKSQG
ncbi:hypothetical protein Tco_0179808 [Tanacetum coccineum]